MTEKEKKNDKPEFTIVDKRSSAKKTGETGKDSNQKNDNVIQQKEKDEKKVEQKLETKEAPSKDKAGKSDTKQYALPDVDFSSLIISLSTSVYIHLGEIPEPTTNQKEINLPLAKQTIDIISILKEKTEGNRTQEEDKLLDEMLYNLRMSYVAALNKSK